MNYLRSQECLSLAGNLVSYPIHIYQSSRVNVSGRIWRFLIETRREMLLIQWKCGHCILLSKSLNIWIWDPHSGKREVYYLPRSHTCSPIGFHRCFGRNYTLHLQDKKHAKQVATKIQSQWWGMSLEGRFATPKHEPYRFWLRVPWTLYFWKRNQVFLGGTEAGNFLSSCETISCGHERSEIWVFKTLWWILIS